MAEVAEESIVADANGGVAEQSEDNNVTMVSQTDKVEEDVASTGEQIETVKPETELDKYWKAVRENPNDFTGWTYLLQYVEQEGVLEASEEAYDAFFQHYPYCYGYWKKYSDLHKKMNDSEKCVKVFERGVKAVPLSVELWLHYINFCITEFVSEDDGEDRVRQLYERAIVAAGTDFRSDKLWDSFIAWENIRHNKQKVTKLYHRLISIPTQLYSHHYDNYKKHISENHPKDFLSLDDFLKIRQKVMKSNDTKADVDDEVSADAPPGDDELPPGIEAPPGETELGGMGDEQETKKLRSEILEDCETIYRLNEEEVSKRWVYEEAIRRPYFHVKPLEKAQLKNWREYLDFEIENGSHERVVVLFERCMIACALYEDFWMKYAKYLEQNNDVAGVHSVYKRACNIHLLKKPYIHLSWASFEERQGNCEQAREVLRNIEKNIPSLVMVSMRRTNLERRHGNLEAVEALYNDYISNGATTSVKTFYSIKFARYLRKGKGNVDQAREVLEKALEQDKGNERLLLQLLDLEYQCQPIDEQRMLKVFTDALESDLSSDFKMKISQRRMEFLEDFGTCIQRITEAYDEHQKLVKDTSNDRKTKRIPDSIDDDHNPPEKKHKYDKYKTETSNGGGDVALQQSSQDLSAYNYWPSQSYTGYYQQPQPQPSSYSSYNYGSYYQT